MKTKAITENKVFQSFDNIDFESYLNLILHQWLKTLVTFGITLVPLFFILDFMMTPRELHYQFALYRGTSTVLSLIQYIIIRNTKPAKYSYIHGYIITFYVGGIISAMTVQLGGFASDYYVGLILVMVAVNLLLPWKPINSLINSLIIIGTYGLLNIALGKNIVFLQAINPFFFLSSMAIISISINYVKNKLEMQEFFLRAELQQTRDALWGEMEIAKRIQTALLPKKEQMSCFDTGKIGCYAIAASMTPADEVGGDYYDVIETAKGERWIAIGDVSGHGVESGLIMLMMQTSIFTIANNTAGYNPSVVLSAINPIVKENIARLGTDRYASILLIRLNDNNMLVAGKHQDILIYRSKSKKVEVIKTEGTWIGIYDKIRKYLKDKTIPVDIGDIILLFTDGITEATDRTGLMFGQERLVHALEKYSDLPVKEILNKIMQDVTDYWDKQRDDVTLLVVKREW
jgi:phosphoserine phosphatase RsbU/P